MSELLTSELPGELEKYILTSDIRQTTIAYYRRVMRQFLRWLQFHPEQKVVTELTVSAFLLHMQEAGHSSYYRRSLRNGILAVLAAFIDSRKVRRVRLDELHSQGFTKAEVGRLIRACRKLPAAKADYYGDIIPAAYHSGLSQVDLHRIERHQVAADGTIEIERSRTGKLAVVWIPPEIVERRPAKGKIFPRLWSDEQFRRDFQAICKIAGVEGTFKKLRKTSGTEADLITGGLGHLHLANSRKVFERHYLDRRMCPKQKPVKLRQIRV